MLGYMVLHRPLGSELISAPLERYIPLRHSSALHSQYWSHTTVLERQVWQCEAILQGPKGRVRENYYSQPPLRPMDSHPPPPSSSMLVLDM